MAQNGVAPHHKKILPSTRGHHITNPSKVWKRLVFEVQKAEIQSLACGIWHATRYHYKGNIGKSIKFLPYICISFDPPKMGTPRKLNISLEYQRLENEVSF